MRNVSVGIAFYSLNRVLLFACRSRAVGSVLEVAPGPGYTDCVLRKCPFKGGSYPYNLYAENGTKLDDARDLGTVRVEEGDYYGTGYLPATGTPGVLVEYEWQNRSVVATS
jgi:lipopolysaccharide transport system ATP-binding protein